MIYFVYKTLINNVLDDRTRVKLREVLNVHHSDYINANFIVSLKFIILANCNYILCNIRILFSAKNTV